MKEFIFFIAVCFLGYFFMRGLYLSIKEIFTTKEPVNIVNGQVIYKTTGKHWLYNFTCSLLVVFIFSGILQIISYYLN